MCEFPYFGRRNTIITTSLFGMFSIILGALNPSYFVILFSICNFTIFLSLPINVIFISETYPTALRLKTLGFAYGLIKLGGSVSQLIFLELSDVNVFAPYWLLAVLLGLTALSTYFTEYETLNKPLDFIVHEGMENNLAEEMIDIKIKEDLLTK